MKKKKVDIVQDFGRVNIPTKWEEVTLSQLQKLMKLQETAKEEKRLLSTKDVLSIFTGKEPSYINSLPAEFIESLLANLVFLSTDMDAKPHDAIVIGDEAYFINHHEKLTFGEYVDANTIMQEQPGNYSALLAILCRKKGEAYDDEFIADKLDKRIEMFDNASCVDAMNVISFFLLLSLNSKKCSQASLTTAVQQADQLLQDIQSSLRDGDGKKPSFLSRMKIYYKLRKYRKCLRQLSSTTSAT